MIDLTKLKIGSKLYSPLLGDVIVTNICYNETLCIKVSANEYRESFTKEGYYFINKGLNVECLLFPSKECRDWSLYDFETGTIKYPNPPTQTTQTTTKKLPMYRGNAKRGADVIRALEKEGGVTEGLSGIYEDYFYYIGDNYTICNISSDSLWVWLLKQLFELKELPDAEDLIPDKTLVICWDNDTVCSRSLDFYDAKNKCTFSPDGKRGSFKYDNYLVFEGEYPEWAKEAIKLLED